MKSEIVLSAITAFMLVFNQFFTYPVFADDYTVSGNGEESSNSMNVKKENSETVRQNNDAEINNEVDTESNTGNNEANDNSGETEIATGDANQEVTVENSGNSNSYQNSCCPEEESSAQVTGNGSESENQINYGQNTSTKVVQKNNLHLTNNIYINANTGDNQATGNDGDVIINTGEVNVLTQILNRNLNYSYISASGQNRSFNLNIYGNGPGSTNYIDDNFYSNDEYLVNNYLELNNNVRISANTGGNKANKNNGKVLITTGNIYLDLILSNKVNTSKIIADCGCKSTASSPTPGPSESPYPSSPPSSSAGGGAGGSGGSGGDSSSSSGGSGGQVLGATLPATGGFSILQATMFTLLMLLSGVILRLDYGKTKNLAGKVKTKIAFTLIHNLPQNIGQSVNWKLPLPVPRYLPAYYKSLPSC